VKLTLAGIIFGLIVAAILTCLMSSLLFGITASDPLISLFVCVLLALVAIAACLIPARRACRVDPISALRVPNRPITA
jgi:putative ABC transport system permease protein